METITRLSTKIAKFVYPDGTRALHDVTLEINKGDFIGLLGANGSGKTTLLKILDGLIKDYEGTTKLDGEEIRRLSPRDIYSKVGLVFQNPDDQLFASKVLEDVLFGPINMGFSKNEAIERATRALTDVGMEHLAQKSIHHLSYGQKKKVCIAGLLSMGHEILLLDEPTAGLDPMGEYQMMELLTRLNKEHQVTIVMATHSVELVPLFLSRLYVLSKGTILRSGTPENVFTGPEEMADVKLRLPKIAELIYTLKHGDKLPFAALPLTVGEARREILRILQ